MCAEELSRNRSLSSTTRRRSKAFLRQTALGEFKGGDAVIYIGGGALSVLVIVLLIVLLA